MKQIVIENSIITSNFDEPSPVPVGGMAPLDIIDELSDLVEKAVPKEFDAISKRGGVLGAMEAD